jgi:thiol:disulfide interchange protein
MNKLKRIFGFFILSLPIITIVVVAFYMNPRAFLIGFGIVAIPAITTIVGLELISRSEM